MFTSNVFISMFPVSRVFPFQNSSLITLQFAFLSFTCRETQETRGETESKQH